MSHPKYWAFLVITIAGAILLNYAVLGLSRTDESNDTGTGGVGETADTTAGSGPDEDNKTSITEAVPSSEVPNSSDTNSAETVDLLPTTVLIIEGTPTQPNGG